MEKGILIRFLKNWPNVLQKTLAAIDNLVATPSNNTELLIEMEKNPNCPGPDVKHPYPTINNSPHASAIKSSLLFLAFFSIFFSYITHAYRKMREKKRCSYYCVFEKLYPMTGQGIKNIKFPSRAPQQILKAFAYYYNKDIPFFWRYYRKIRGIFGLKPGYWELKNYIKSYQNVGISKKKLFKRINHDIFNTLLLFIKNNNTQEWKLQENNGVFSIEPTLDFIHQWNKNDIFLDAAEQKNTNKFITCFISFINARINELGAASFVYWIGAFLYYFLPGLGIISLGAAVVVYPPILCAFIYLVGRWLSNFIIFITKFKAPINSNHSECSKDDLKDIIRRKTALEIWECDTDIAQTPQAKEKITFFKSKVYKEIITSLKNQRKFLLCRAILNEFVMGFFVICFSAWLLTSTAALFCSLGATTLLILSGLTFCLGLLNGIYRAKTYYFEKLQKLLLEEKRFEKLIKLLVNFEILNLTAREYDRLFRLGYIYATPWTKIKQAFQRISIGSIRFGTGLLFFRLSIMNPASQILGALCLSAMIPLCCTFTTMMCVGLLFAAWFIFQYNFESKEKLSGTMLDFLSNYYRLEKSISFFNKKLDVNNNKPTCFYSLSEFKSNDKFLEARLKNSRIEANGKVFMEEPAIKYMQEAENNSCININSEKIMPKRKRSGTWSGFSKKPFHSKKQEIPDTTNTTLHGYNDLKIVSRHL